MTTNNRRWMSARWIIGVPLIVLMFVLPWQLWLVLFAVGVAGAYFMNRREMRDRR